MTNRRFVGVAALAAVCAATPISTAQGSTLRTQYRHRYDAVAKQFGTRAPGRDILRYGILRRGKQRPATRRELAASAATLARMLAPPPVTPVTPVARTATSTSTSSSSYAPAPSSSAGGTLEQIAACESGGNPSAVSPDGSYRGKYQFDYGTWASVGGSGDPAAASEAEQDQRAAALYAQRGAAPWPVCGQ